MDQHQSWTELVLQVLSILLWVTRRVLRVLLRRPVLDVLLVLLVLYFIASFIGSVNQPQPVLFEPPTVFEGR
jgi:hypothetical protein